MRKKNRRTGGGGLIWFLLLVIGGFVVAQFYSALFRCILVRFSDFRKVESRLYVDPGLAKNKMLTLESDILKAKKRVVELYGGCLADPVIIASDNYRSIGKFGTIRDGTAITHISLFDSYIVLGPNGINIDVIAHEMGRAELAKRVGIFKRERIPTWFEEGLAMQLDYRKNYADEEWGKLTGNGKVVPDIKLIDNPQKFNNREALSHYIIARHEVKQWVGSVGTAGLLELIQIIKKGRDFAEGYRTVLKRMGHKIR